MDIGALPSDDLGVSYRDRLSHDGEAETFKVRDDLCHGLSGLTPGRRSSARQSHRKGNLYILLGGWGIH
jgi:hypothetical protein